MNDVFQLLFAFNDVFQLRDDLTVTGVLYVVELWYHLTERLERKCECEFFDCMFAYVTHSKSYQYITCNCKYNARATS
jgi:hypothetical protein